MWGQMVCSFYSSEIDRAIDSANLHDVSRYVVEELEKILFKVESRFGEKGVCYLILHHYLDRLTDVIVKTLSTKYEFFATGHKSLDDTYRSFYIDSEVLLFFDPKNILSLIRFDINKIKSVLYLRYSRSSRKNYEKRLEEIYNRIRNSPRLLQLREPISRVLNKLHSLYPCLLLTVLLDETSRSSTLNRLANTLQVKIVVEIMKFGASKLLDRTKLENFITHITQRLCEECTNLSKDRLQGTPFEYMKCQSR